jgi:hypothetical protein
VNAVGAGRRIEQTAHDATTIFSLSGVTKVYQMDDVQVEALDLRRRRRLTNIWGSGMEHRYAVGRRVASPVDRVVAARD